MSTSMEPSKPTLCYSSPWRNITFLVLVATIFTLLVVILNSTITSYSLVATQSRQNDVDELERVLEMASMGDNKTVIIAVVNKAYVEGEVVPNMLDLFLEGFWHGEHTRVLVNHLVVVAVDRVAYDRCRFRGLHCYRLAAEEEEEVGEAVYMSKEFIDMMWRRTLFLVQVLNKGYSFVFTDIDVIWLRNPFQALTTKHKDADIQFSKDKFNGDPLSTKNIINTGFYFIKSNNKTIALFENWYNSKDKYPNDKEQDVLQKMAWQGVFDELSIRVRFLETHFFSGFCQDTSNIRDVITVHANCCRFISAKIVDLSKVLREWEKFRMTPPNATTPLQWSKHVECPKSWNKDVGVFTDRAPEPIG